MIVPTAAQMLRNAGHVFDTEIRPELASTAARSSAATISHMLRIAALRIEVEGQLLHEERLRLDALLPRLRAWLEGRGLAAADSIAASPPLAADVYPGLDVMAGLVGTLRAGLCDALETLQAGPRDDAGEALLAQVRDHIAWQLEQEGRMIEPATIGHGPRR